LPECTTAAPILVDFRAVIDQPGADTVSDRERSPEEIAEADHKADLKAIIVIFVALVLGAVHFISGWTFDF
jgi:hypothetical protein